jgi:hypothetical protein
MSQLPPPPALDSETDALASLEIFGLSYDDIMRELHARQLAKVDRMKREMAQAAKQGGERKILRGTDGGGEVTMQIHPVSYHYWGQRLGYQCWDDPQFCREYLRDNEAARVRSRSDKLTIVRPNLPAPTTRNALAPLRPGVHGRRGRWAA